MYLFNQFINFNKWILSKFSGFAAILSYSSTSYFITSLWTSLVTFATSFLTFIYIYIYIDIYIYINENRKVQGERKNISETKY